MMLTAETVLQVGKDFLNDEFPPFIKYGEVVFDIFDLDERYIYIRDEPDTATAMLMIFKLIGTKYWKEE